MHRQVDSQKKPIQLLQIFIDSMFHSRKQVENTVLSLVEYAYTKPGQKVTPFEIVGVGL